MAFFDGVERDNYLGGEPIRRMEVEVRVVKLKNGKAAGEMIKVEDNRVVNCIMGCVIWFLRVVLCRKTGSLL